MDPGTRSDGSDAVGRQLLPAAAWPLTVVIAVTSTEAKHVPSTAGMAASQASSPFYDAWVRQVPADLAEATAAIGGRDFAALAAVAESSCLAMHAVMLAARPGLVYLRGASVDCLHRIRHLRERDGRAVFFTIDAGPQVKAVCLPRDAAAVAAALGEVPGVERVMTVGLGDGARLESPGDAPRRGEA
jgi:diphosphomevalonate decarboxylase